MIAANWERRTGNILLCLLRVTVRYCTTEAMAENKVIERVFEKLAEILTVNQLEKIAQLFLAKSSEQTSNTKDLEATKTILGNLVNLAHKVHLLQIGY